jgi:hypothetical protein
VSRAFAAGRTFSSRTLKAEWAARNSHTSVIDAAGAIYVIGGWSIGGTRFNDVWASTDGGARPDSVGGAVGGMHWVGTTGVLRGYYGGTKGVIRALKGCCRGTQGYCRVLQRVMQGYCRGY